MPSGPETFVTSPVYAQEFLRARELLLAHRRRWRVIYHYDGDGIASASSALRAFERLAYPSQATALFGVESTRMGELLSATQGPVLIVDTGSSWLDRIVQHPFPVVILDHHQYPGAPNPPPLPPHVAFVNPLDWGVDGMSELCAASLTWLFTIFLDPINWDNAPWGLSGIIADRQHQGGLKGLNTRLVDEAVHRSLLIKRKSIPLIGPNVQEALVQGIDPYVRGLSGRPEAVRTLLEGLSIDGAKNPLDLVPEEEERLVRSLRDRLTHQGTRPEFLEVLTQDRWTVPSLGRSADELSNLQNATGRVGAPSLGVGLALGDAASLQRAEVAEAEWRQTILSGLLRIEQSGVHQMTSIQWFESPDRSLAGTQAGLGMTYLLDFHRPVFVFSTEDDRLKVSGRGTLWLVQQGLDLSIACRVAASTVGGEGGGHRVASGATIPGDRRDDFLAAANRIVGEQLSGLAAGSAA
ncbi:MAG: DHH family phosphoesterase [Thermoplasmata archaeon]